MISSTALPDRNAAPARCHGAILRHRDVFQTRGVVVEDLPPSRFGLLKHAALEMEEQLEQEFVDIEAERDQWMSFIVGIDLRDIAFEKTWDMARNQHFRAKNSICGSPRATLKTPSRLLA
jgi:hypothetical protein